MWRVCPLPSPAPFISISSYFACFLFLVIKPGIGNVISNCCLMDVGLVAERYSSLYGCVQVITRGYWGPYNSAFVITWSWEQWPGSFLWYKPDINVFVCPLFRVFDFRSAPSTAEEILVLEELRSRFTLCPSLRCVVKACKINTIIFLRQSQRDSMLFTGWGEALREKTFEFERLVVWKHRTTCCLFCNLAFRLDGPSKYYDTWYDWGNLLATFKRICKEARWLMSPCHHCPQTAQLFSMFPNMHLFLLSIMTSSLRKLLCNWQITSRLQMCVHSS